MVSSLFIGSFATTRLLLASFGGSGGGGGWSSTGGGRSVDVAVGSCANENQTEKTS